MAIRPSDLDTPERGLSLANRVIPRVDPHPEREPEAEPRDDAAAELRAIRGRVKAARTLKPQGGELHCADCWGKGRDAALRVVEGAKT